MSLGTQIRAIQRESLDWVVGHFAQAALERRAENFVSLFGQFVPCRAKVLDIGGGWGFYAEPLRRARDCEVTILDIVEPGFRKAPVTTYAGERIPFPDRSFEVSLLVTVLHHVPVPEKVLAEARRVTRRSVIVVEDLYRHRLGRGWTVLRDTFFTLEWVGHPRQFRKKEEWRRSFEGLGFQVVSEKEVYTSLGGVRILNGIFVLNTNHE